ncbi:orotate phosphoribosyltransferase [Desulfococcaceae bacterium HSG7]|nr:orotate phosphoribosyltransferase [Desulfococcaceae bacterium HSG7]
MKQELIEIIRNKSFQYSQEPVFKLVSGRMSQYYVNCKPTILSPRGMFLTGHLIYDAVKNSDIHGIGGLTFGADPIAMAVAYTSELKQNPIKAFSIRKTQKDHGIVKWIEGDLTPGNRVAIIDDVVTTGGSTIKAIERARAEGMKVIKVVILVDRQEGGLENVQKYVADTERIISIEELRG